MMHDDVTEAWMIAKPDGSIFSVQHGWVSVLSFLVPKREHTVTVATKSTSLLGLETRLMTTGFPDERRRTQ